MHREFRQAGKRTDGIRLGPGYDHHKRPLGRDVHALRWPGRWHAASGSPRNALVAQALIVLALIIAGAFARDGFQTAVDYTASMF